MKFYFTFGCGQKFEGGYHIIEAETRDTARNEMNRKFGSKWSMQYRSAEEAGVAMFGLRKIVLNENQERGLGELRDLLALDHGLRDTEIEWLEIFDMAWDLTPRIINIIDEIYRRVM